MNYQEGIDNSVFVIGMYSQTSCDLVANLSHTNLLIGCTEGQNLGSDIIV